MKDNDQKSKKDKKGTLEERIFSGLAKLEQIRRSRDVFKSDAAVYTYDVKDDSILCILRENEKERFIAIFNFSDEAKTAWMEESGTYENLMTGEKLELVNLTVQGHDFVWASKIK